jgi:DUF1365 family protein
VSFFLFRDAAGTIERVAAEVHNTWGERHIYDLGAPTPAAKDFYVSPFLDIAGHYEFHMRERPDQVRIRIDYYADPDGPASFRAGMDLRPLPLTNANVARMLLRYPLSNIKTVAAIHWQGLKLWLRGEPFRPNPSRRHDRPPSVRPSTGAGRTGATTTSGQERGASR